MYAIGYRVGGMVSFRFFPQIDPSRIIPCSCVTLVVFGGGLAAPAWRLGLA